MAENISEQQSTWKTKLGALGPGILMASAAVGGSHIVSSTQAGAIYGWQLAIIVLLINVFKYPFFRFASTYTIQTGRNLVEGYAEKGKFYLWIFFILNIFSEVVNIAGVGILCAAIVSNIFPGLGMSITTWSTIIIAVILGMLLIGGYRFIDGLSKWVMSALTIATVVAVIIAAFQTREYAPDFVVTSPWTMTALPFIVSLMGWMPAPLEISAINSLWSAEKRKTVKMAPADALFDFNTGFIGTAILAFIFLALGALIQYGNGEAVESASAAYIAQFVNMYASVLGSWTSGLINFIAFLCIFGTVITVIDGYSRANNETLRLILNRTPEEAQKTLNYWLVASSIIGLLIIYFFTGNVAIMLRFAMIASFITTPFFAFLNFSLVNTPDHRVSGWIKLLAIAGLIYLFGFALFFVYAIAIGAV